MFWVIGQAHDDGAQPDTVPDRVEVAIASAGLDATVFVTKYRSGQVGERSIGMSREVAAEIGGLLLIAATSPVPKRRASHLGKANRTAEESRTVPYRVVCPQCGRSGQGRSPATCPHCFVPTERLR